MGKRDGKRAGQDVRATSADKGQSQVTHFRPWLMSPGAALKLLVVCAGAVLMGLEIAGSRILAPHFGNSVFVWGSLISVFLIALAAGYQLGGTLADRYPSQHLLNIICIAVAAWIFLLATIGHPICEGLLDRGLGEQSGPLLASAILFLPPSIGLGMVSPLSVRVAATSVRSIGQVAGSLYALSTLGSIAGTLLVTFVLIPMMGVAAILKILAGALVLAALATLPHWRDMFGRRALVLSTLVFSGGLLLPASPAFPLGSADVVQADVNTPYHHITIVDNAIENARRMRFDKYSETSIRLSPPYQSLDAYPSYFHLAFLLRPKMERVLFIGAGGGVGARTFFAHDPELEIDVVDIDPAVLALAKQYFHLPDSPSIRLVARDGRMYLRQSHGQYDCIILDAFTIGGRIPFHLVTREFFELCRARLAGDGVFVMNLGSALDGPRSGIFRSAFATFSEVFPHVYVFAIDKARAGRLNTTNIILIGGTQPEALTERDWIARAAQYSSASYVAGPEVRKMIGDFTAETVDPTAPKFSDDFAPLETMSF